MVLTPAVWREGGEEEEENRKERVEDKSSRENGKQKWVGRVTEKDRGAQREREREKNETHNTKREIIGAGWRPSLRSNLEQRMLGVSIGEDEEVS